MGKEANMSPNTNNNKKRHKMNSKHEQSPKQEHMQENDNDNQQSVIESESNRPSPTTSLQYSSCEDLKKSHMKTANQEESSSSSPTTNRHTKRLPPIFLDGYNTKDLINILKSNQIEGFSIKNNAKVNKISL